MASPRLWVAAVLSGILSYAGVMLLQELFGSQSGPWHLSRFVPGVVFGVLVLAPRIGAGRGRLARQVGAVAASVLIYYLAVELAIGLKSAWGLPAYASCMVAGVLGALATGVAVGWLTPIKLSWAMSLRAALCGAVGGAVLGANTAWLGLPSVIADTPIVLGFVIWQLGVALAWFQPTAAAVAPLGAGR